MTFFGYKDTEAALHAYTGTLSGLKLGQSFFAQLNFEYARLIIELFKRLFKTNSISRLDEFLNDFKLFSEDMLHKYGSTSPCGYSLKYPFERGIEDKTKQEESDALARIASKFSNGRSKNSFDINADDDFELRL